MNFVIDLIRLGLHFLFPNVNLSKKSERTFGIIYTLLGITCFIIFIPIFFSVIGIIIGAVFVFSGLVLIFDKSEPRELERRQTQPEPQIKTNNRQNISF